MQRASKLLGLVVLLFIGLALLSCKPEGPRATGPQTGANISSQSTPTRTCVPTPLPPTDVVGTPTPTPVPSEFGTPPSVRPPSVTPLPLSKTTDLAPDLPDNEKAYVYVFRCNGTYELFLVRPAGVETTQTIPLQAGDIILHAFPPASLVGHQPPGPPPTESPFASPLTTPTILPLPGPTLLPPAVPVRQPTSRPLGTPDSTPSTP